jgi:hypothetical protein
LTLGLTASIPAASQPAPARAGLSPERVSRGVAIVVGLPCARQQSGVVLQALGLEAQLRSRPAVVGGLTMQARGIR